MTVLKGNNKNNTLYGDVSNDILYGYGNNDLLNGNAGNDILNGGRGIDTLIGGAGNDALRINELNGDIIDGGTGIDSLQIHAIGQTLDLSTASTLKNIEVIRLANSHSTLKITTQSVTALSDDSNTLKIDASDHSNSLIMQDEWIDSGIIDNYHTFTMVDTVLRVNTNINAIKVMPADTIPYTLYTISNTASANTVQTIFDHTKQVIMIDFGGIAYNAMGLTQIDLTGFALEDKLIIARHDGAAERGGLSLSYASYSSFTTHYPTFTPSAGYGGSVVITLTRNTDNIIWLSESGKVTLTSQTLNHSGGSIQLTGLPVNLSADQFAFI